MAGFEDSTSKPSLRISSAITLAPQVAASDITRGLASLPEVNRRTFDFAKTASACSRDNWPISSISIML